MARNDRTGNLKARDQRERKRYPEMGFYLVVTDTEATERCFFNGLHAGLPESVKQKLIIKVVETKTQNLIQKCREMTAYEAQYRIPWIVFDRDQVPNFDAIIREALAADIHVGWSNPCFEIWMFTYFGSMPTINESWTCCSKFGDLYESAAETMMDEKNLIVCDRGMMDNSVYMAEKDFRAAELDAKLIAAWGNHPYHRVIDINTDFENKMRRLIAEIGRFLGEDGCF